MGMHYITQYLTEIIIGLPIVMTILLYQIHYRIKKQKWLAIHFSTQASSIFYVIAVSIMIDEWLPFHSIGYILIVVLILLSINVIRQWKKDTEVNIKQAFKVVLRFIFLIFFIAYMVIGVVKIVFLWM